MKARYLLLLIAVGALTALSVGEGQDLTGGPAEAEALMPWEIVSSQGLRNLGSRSCSSTYCHGSVRPDSEHDNRMRRDEYLVWLEEDPHQRAHAILSGPRSRTIFTNLGLSKGDEEYDLVERKCIACHAMPVEVAGSDGAQTVAYEGVSCEMCHGPAEKWLATHYNNDFVKMSATEKVRLGFFNTNDAIQGARLCVACHVGDQQREVNHDWIAAGHPALKFELTAYLSLMPSHWKASRDRTNAETPADHQLELWLAGQRTAADASLAQLARRAEQAASGRQDAVWPEFAELDCYACHHDLGPPRSWRQGRGFGVEQTRRSINRVTLPVSEWYLFMLAQLAAGSDDDEAAAKRFEEQWQQLRRLMERDVVPAEDKVALLAHSTRKALDQWLSQHPPAVQRREILGVMAEGDGRQLVSNWDRAVQAYLALQVIKGDAQQDEQLKELRNLLAFPVERERHFDSPRAFVGVLSGEQGAQPVTIRDQVLKHILDVQKELGPKRE